MDCINYCCDENKESRSGLKIKSDCRFKAGIYRNVNIEIGDDCKVKWLEQADKEVVLMCDPCGASDD
ncbi:hypothetical protein HPC38_01410 [Pasteurellaceae bacterium HPA106]|uniref:hypothetical protein n=1 Tax=Spirabiliibacterium pneumoniae TaxID=221400 RepID=UPI001AADFA89|nr:hypothetical protein [Spirabiliibacterium pneumoniae]MBE2895535.1 hypothetical protein [Spirabiliibacterium pneumoniae]